MQTQSAVLSFLYFLFYKSREPPANRVVRRLLNTLLFTRVFPLSRYFHSIPISKCLALRILQSHESYTPAAFNIYRLSASQITKKKKKLRIDLAYPFCILYLYIVRQKNHLTFLYSRAIINYLARYKTRTDKNKTKPLRIKRFDTIIRIPP